MVDTKAWEQTAKMTSYYRKEYAALKGRRVTDVRAMFPEEMKLLMWYGQPGAVLTMDDGTMFIPMRDEEGNGAGDLLIQEVER